MTRRDSRGRSRSKRPDEAQRWAERRKRSTRRAVNVGNVLADLVGASGAVFAVLVDDGRSLLEGTFRSARESAERLLDDRTWTAQIWLPSFVSLGAVDLALGSALGPAAKGLELVGATAGVGLIAASSLDLWHADSTEQRLDAGSDLMWGAQGLSYLSSSGTITTLATGLGFVGAVVQMSSGILRVSRGIRSRDPETLKLGALDLGGGILWAGWDVMGWANPGFLASYMLLMVGREAFANKDAIRRWLAMRGVLARPI